MVNVSEALEIDKILEYSGFDDSSQQTIIESDGFDIYDDILTLGGSDIVNLAKGFSDRIVAAESISFGLSRTNILKATINWSQDFRRISQTPSLIGTSNASEFCSEIKTARQRAKIRKPYGWREDDTSNQNWGVSPRGPDSMWSVPWGSTVPARPSYMPRSPENPRAYARRVRYDFLCQRHCNRMQSPSTSFNPIVNMRIHCSGNDWEGKELE